MTALPVAVQVVACLFGSLALGVYLRLHERRRLRKRNPLSRGRRAYKRAHWGLEGGPDLALVVAPTDHGDFVIVGTWEDGVTYSTMKGDDQELVDYTHVWGDGGSAVCELPVLWYHDCKRATKCEGHRKMGIAGGSYYFDPDRGIVG